MAARPKRNRQVPLRLREAASVSEIAEAMVKPKRAEKGKKEKQKRGKPPLTDQLPPLPAPSENHGETFLIDRIVDVDDKEMKAFVSFKGWDASHNEWIPFTHLSEKVR